MPLLLLLSLVLAAASVRAADWRSTLQSEWEGKWVVVKSGFESSCSEFSTEHLARGGEISDPEMALGELLSLFGVGRTDGAGLWSSYEHRVAAGELGRVKKLEINRGSLRLGIEVVAPSLVPYEHGPFTLYEEAGCAVGLDVDVLRKSIKRGDVADIERRLGKLVEAHESEEQARSSRLWNGREHDSPPAGHEQTQREYALWRNAAVAEGLTAAWEMVRWAADALPDLNSRVLDFIEGTLALRNAPLDSCRVIVGRDFSHFQRTPEPYEPPSRPDDILRLGLGFDEGPDAERYEEIDEETHLEGQRLVYAIRMLEQLPTCRIGVPADPDSGEGGEGPRPAAEAQIATRAGPDAAIDEALPEALEWARLVLDSVHLKASYVSRFARGIRRQRKADPGTCDYILDQGLRSLGGDAPGRRAGRYGENDSRKLYFALQALGKLPDCRVVTAEGPAEAGVTP